MEITEKDGKLDGRFQPRGGAWRPLVAAKVDSGHLILTLAEATPRGPATTWDFTAAGDKLTGVEKRGETAGPQIAGVRAPELKRPMPKAWTTPVAIFNGKDLTGWEPIGNVQNNKWVARDGELVNDNPVVEGQRGPGAANIKTTAEVAGFQTAHRSQLPGARQQRNLSARPLRDSGRHRRRHPADSRDGRGVQSLSPRAEISASNSGNGPRFDITFVGRNVTVIRDGVKIHDNVEIPGPTGGALDSNEGEPGPFFLQGDHQGVIRYRNITISVPK